MASAPTVLQGKPFNEAIKPLLWLLGKWESVEGKGTFPTIPPFSYGEQIEFTSFGQPMVNYSSFSWHPEKKTAMHLESGFLRIKPGTNQVAFLVAHNFGLTTVEEGEVVGNKVSMTSKDITRMSWAKDPAVTKIVRTFELLNDHTLEQVLHMETSSTPLCEHLKIVYKRKP
ncbi:Peroxynitrite isomerase THAP4 [Frankliniella fusca]|uniref:Peroxynitrite isomerase THAP4 n=1 Tax=Frankliniella fusca TaxID=407009 RepID=A0AAE1HRU6_9NEOP|nr:Peroxynitrite isomerase THAP4 [Frankliniella fusca]